MMVVVLKFLFITVSLFAVTLADVKLVVGKVEEYGYKPPDRYHQELGPGYPSTLHHDGDDRYSYHLRKLCQGRSCVSVTSLKFNEEVLDTFRVASQQLTDVYGSIDIIISKPSEEVLKHKVILRMTSKDCLIREYTKHGQESEGFAGETRTCDGDKDYQERRWVTDQWDQDRRQEITKRKTYKLFRLFYSEEKDTKQDVESMIKPIKGIVEQYGFDLPLDVMEVYTTKYLQKVFNSIYVYKFTRFCYQRKKEECFHVVKVMYQNEIVEMFKVASSKFTIATLNSIEIIVPSDRLNFGTAHRFILRMADRRCLIRSLARFDITLFEGEEPVVDTVTRTATCAEDSKHYRDNNWVREEWERQQHFYDHQGHQEGKGDTEEINEVSNRNEEEILNYEKTTAFKRTEAALENTYPFEVGVVEEFDYDAPEEYNIRTMSVETKRTHGHVRYVLFAHRVCTKKTFWKSSKCVSFVTFGLETVHVHDLLVLDYFKISSLDPFRNVHKSIGVWMPETADNVDTHKVTIITTAGQCKVRRYTLPAGATKEADNYIKETADCEQPAPILARFELEGEVIGYKNLNLDGIKEVANYHVSHPYDSRYNMLYSKYVYTTPSGQEHTCIITLNFQKTTLDRYRMATCDVSRATWGSVDVIVPRGSQKTPSVHKVIVRTRSKLCLVVAYQVRLSWRGKLIATTSARRRCHLDQDYRDNQWVTDEWEKVKHFNK